MRVVAPVVAGNTQMCANVGSAGDPPPGDPKELTLLALDSRTPYTTDFDGADAGKTAHHMLRWVSTTAEKGPWSETASATIGA